MYGYQLKRLVERDRVLRGKFLGVFSKNTLPRLVQGREAAFISNTQHSSRVGKHWISFYYTSKKVLFILDPLSKPIRSYGEEFVDFINTLKPKRVIQLKRAVQDEKKSKLCGYFNILFLYFLVRHYPLMYILHEKLRTNPRDNDVIVEKFIRQKFGYKSKEIKI